MKLSFLLWLAQILPQPTADPLCLATTVYLEARDQSELGQRTVTSSTGGGMVTVTADGRGHVRSIKIDPAAVDPQDLEMLEDLIVAAVREAQTRAAEVYEEEMRKLSGGFNLPFQIPGL